MSRHLCGRRANSRAGNRSYGQDLIWGTSEWASGADHLAVTFCADGNEVHVAVWMICGFASLLLLNVKVVFPGFIRMHMASVVLVSVGGREMECVCAGGRN